MHISVECVVKVMQALNIYMLSLIRYLFLVVNVKGYEHDISYTKLIKKKQHVCLNRKVDTTVGASVG